MRTTPWVLLVLALLVLWGLVGVWRKASERTADSLFASAKQRIEGDAPDIEGGLRELELALALARTQALSSGASSAELSAAGAAAEEIAAALAHEEQTRQARLTASAVLEYRAGVYRKRGAGAFALRDYQELEREYKPGDLPLFVRIAEMELSLGQAQAALDRTHAILEKQPQWHHVRVLTGNAAMVLGQAQLDQGIEQLQLELADSAATKGAQMLNQLASIDPGDPLRGALQHELLALFPADDQYQAQSICQLGVAASDYLLEARQQYALGLWTSAHPQAVYGLIDLYQRARNLSAIVDLGLAALPQPSAMTPQSLQVLALTLDELGRPRAAAKIIDEALGSNASLPLSFLPRWCQILYEAKQWGPLEAEAERLYLAAPGGVAGAEQRSAGQFYRGVANLGLNRNSAAQSLLESYTSGTMAEPFEGARPEAFLRLAEAAQRNNQTAAQRTALESALRLDPQRDAQAWRMLAELSTQANQTEEAESAYAQAIRLAPARWEDMYGLWWQAGEAHLAAQQRDLLVVRNNLRQEGRWFPARGAGSFELYRLAEMHLQAGAPQGAVDTLNYLLERYPGFLPAMSLLTDAYLELRRVPEAAELLLQRLELAGLDEETLPRLRNLPREELTNQQVLRLMRFDPRYSGLLTIAQDLAAQGKLEQALSSLNVALGELGSEGRVLAGQYSLALGRFKETGTLLEPIAADDEFYSQALRLRLSAALSAGEQQKLTRLVEEIAAAERLDPAELLRSSDALLARGDSSSALVLLGRLDELGGALRGEVLIRLGLCHLLQAPAKSVDLDEQGLPTRDTSLAAADFARAEAFRDDGASDLGVLLAEISNAHWSELAMLARRARDASICATPLAQALLSIFEERLDEAQVRLEQGLVQFPEDPLWGIARAALAQLRAESLDEIPGVAQAERASLELLISGSARTARDPRLVAALLLALETRQFAPWALAELQRLPRGGRDKSLGPWPAYLAARAELSLGELPLAEQRLALLTQEQTSFEAAWRLREALALPAAAPGSDAWIQLRAERRAALGPRAGEEAEELQVRARSLRQEGKDAQALTRLEEALRLDPRYLPAKLDLARLQVDLGEAAKAQATYAEYFTMASADTASQALPEFLSLLAASFGQNQLSASLYAAELDALARRLPRDPAVALAQAQLVYASVPSDSALGVGRAFLRLDQFRSGVPDEALDTLRPGAVRSWFDFYLRVEPERAESFVRSELDARPGSLEAWLMLGEALEAQSRPTEALEQYDAIRLMIAEPRALRRLAAITADFGTDHGRVEAALTQVARLEGSGSDARSLEFIRARSLVNSGPQYLGQGIAVLARLWEDQQTVSPSISRATIGQRYATALLHRGDASDGPRAVAVLQEVLLEQREGQRKDLLQALLGLARNMKAPGT